MMCFNVQAAWNKRMESLRQRLTSDLRLVVTSDPWHHEQGWLRNDATEMASTIAQTPDWCLQSLAVSLSAKSIFLFGTHTVTLRCKQVSHCQLRRTLC